MDGNRLIFGDRYDGNRGIAVLPRTCSGLSKSGGAGVRWMAEALRKACAGS